MPLKIKFFLWQVFNNKVQVGVNLIKKGWKGKKTCVCGGLESIEHMSFHCNMENFVWGIIKELFQLSCVPSSLSDLSMIDNPNICYRFMALNKN